jgi:hypothetical protein
MRLVGFGEPRGLRNAMLVEAEHDDRWFSVRLSWSAPLLAGLAGFSAALAGGLCTLGAVF